MTATINSRISNGALRVEASNNIFGDSWKGVPKSLVVVYQHEGYEPVTAIVPESTTLNIPPRPFVSHSSSHDCPSYPLRIVGAAYGLAEVTGQVRSLVNQYHLDVVASNSVFRDSWKGEGKTLVVVYQRGDGPYMTKFVTEGNRLQI